MATAEQILNLARKELGYQESPRNSNRTKYGKWFELDGNPWCMMFVMWIFHKAGASALLPAHTASCGDFVKAAKKAGNWRGNGDLSPGDIVIFDFPRRGSETDHVGIVEELADDGAVMTIEGNTSADSDDNGGAVMRRKRKRSLIAGAFRPAYEAERVDEAAETQDSGAEASDNVSGAEASDSASGAGASDNASGAEASGNASGAEASDNANGAEASDGTSGAEASDNAGGAESEPYRYGRDDGNAPKAGDLVMFKGAAQYSSPYDDAEARPAASCMARVDAYCRGTARPFRLYGHGVDGWTAFDDAEPLSGAGLMMDNVAYHEEADGLSLDAGAFAVEITARSSLCVRGGPGADFPELYALASGTTVMALEEGNGWAKLSCGGWISLHYARKL